MNVVPAAGVKVKCTEFEPEWDLVDTMLTVFAATELSIVHADPSVVPLSKPSQKTAAAGQPAPPSPEAASPEPPALSAAPPSPFAPASCIVIPPLDPLDPPVMTPPPFPPDELLLAPPPPFPPDELLLAPPPLFPPDELLPAPPLLRPLPAPTLPPLLEDEPTCVIVAAPPLDEPLCATDPASGPGDDAVLLQATSAMQSKPLALVRPGPRVQGGEMVIRSPRLVSAQ
jgi:hypothetical protein